MENVKIIHVTFVALSFAGFFIRGLWMLKDSALLRQRWGGLRFCSVYTEN